MDVMTTNPGIPRKVLRRLDGRVHMDCLAAGVEGCCDKCQIKITEAFDHFYGHNESTADLLAAIITDLDEDHS